MYQDHEDHYCFAAVQVWDYVFLGKGQPTSSRISPDMLQRMRREFEYWYPFDLRVSGKDLIQVRGVWAAFRFALSSDGGACNII